MTASSSPSRMPPNVRAIHAHLAHRRAQAALEEMRIRYDVGLLVRHLRSSLTPPAQARALAELGKPFGLGKSSLRKLGRLVDVIGDEEFEQYLAASSPRRFRLSWSHLEELATVRDPVLRRTLGRVAVDEELPVRRLAKRIQAATKP